jgi:hypothetical protein
MLRFKLAGAFLILLVTTCGLWQFRFATNPDFPTLTLGDLRSSATLVPGTTWTGPAAKPELLLEFTSPTRSVVQQIPLPHLPPTRWLHLRLRLQASDLERGPQPWSDGRLILEWRSAGKSVEFDHLCSVRGDQDSGLLTVIARPNRQSATPVLRLEHLGTSGAMRVLTFEATVVEERAVWNWGKWLVLLGWAAWFSAAAGIAANRGRLRPLAAAAVWLFMAVTFSFPGPWKTLRPLATPFQIGPELHQTPAPAPAAATPPPPPDSPPPPVASAGRIPPQGSVLVKLKELINRYCASLKPLYHIPLLFAPTLLSLLLISPRRSLALAAFTAVTIEAAQLAFGYSLDWLDALDLLCDALGILLAWRAHRWLAKRRTA